MVAAVVAEVVPMVVAVAVVETEVVVEVVLVGGGGRWWWWWALAALVVVTAPCRGRWWLPSRLPLSLHRPCPRQDQLPLHHWGQPQSGRLHAG